MRWLSNRADPLKSSSRRVIWQEVAVACGLFLLALAVYRVMAGDLFGKQSLAPYFVYLSEAFLNGNVNLPNPPATYDLILFEGDWFVAQAPLPAIVMLPMVVLRGARLSDVSVGVLFGAINVVACYWTLWETVPGLSKSRRVLVTLFFGLGTAQLFMSAMGTVWFLGQIVTTGFVWGFIFSIVRRHYLLAGLMLGFVMLGRPSIVPAGLLLFAGMIWLDQHASQTQTSITQRLKHMWRPVSISLMPFLAAGLLLAAYNMARFDHPLDFGYDHLQDAPNIREKRETHGQFSPAFLADNLYIATIKPLTVHPDCLTDSTCGVLEADLEGNGLLWTSPALLLMFWAWRQPSSETRRIWLFAAVSIVALIPSLFYHNTGSAQFGYRFALDGLPFATILVAYGAKRSPLWLVSGLVMLSIGVNMWGTRWFMNQLGI